MTGRAPWLDAALADRASELLGQAGALWVEECQSHVEFAMRRWGLHSPEAIAGGRGGLVLRATRSDGKPVVLKAPFAEASRHIRAQATLAEAGVGPQVWEVDEDRGLLILEYVPALPLRRPASGEEIRAAGRSVARLHAANCDESFPLLSSWLAPRLAAEPADRAPDLSSSESDRERASEVLAALTAVGPEDVFVHADLNAGNVLYNARRTQPVVLIDARGVLGDPAYDYGLLASKLLDKESPKGQIEETAASLAEDAGHSPDRAAAWVDVVLTALV